MKSFIAILSASMIASAPIEALGQSYDQTHNFCRISQMLVPIFLRGGNISGESVCVAGGGASYECNSSMSLGAGICIAGGGASYECNSSMSLGAGICIAGGGASYECSGIGNQDLGEGICLALGGRSYQCTNMSVSEAVCGFTGNCAGRDAASIAISMAETCGVAVLHYGIE